MTPQSDEALDVLRDVWGSKGQGPADVDEVCLPSSKKMCKNAVHMGFDGLTEEEGGEDLRSAWKNQLAREGKLKPGTSTVADLIRDTQEA